MRKLPDLKFYVDRHRGSIGQTYVANMFRSWGWTVKEVELGYFPDFDMQCTRVTGDRYQVITVETKHDYHAPETNNLVLEFDGLDHSKADMLVIVTGDPIQAVYLMRLSDARTYAHSKEARQYVREVGKLKNGKPNYGPVVPESVLLKSVPKIEKLLVSTAETLETPKKDYQREMSLFISQSEKTNRIAA